MAGFEELGLSDALVERARERGFDAPTTLQRSVIPVIRRGGNALIRASSGSGITAAYAVALTDRFNDATDLKALVVTPTMDRAESVAGTLAGFARGSSVRVSALTSGWSAAADATIVVGSAERLLKAMEESQLKLESVESVIIDNAAATQRLHGTDALETILTALPKEAQRIMITSELNDAVKKLAESHARKALQFPPGHTDSADSTDFRPVMTLQYVVATFARKADLVARFARQSGGAITLLCRSAAAAHTAEDELRGRGFDVRGVTCDGFDRGAAVGSVFAYGPPFSSEQLTDCLLDSDIVVCERHELPHLKAIAADANVALKSASLPTYEVDSLNAFRNEIRRAAREEDLESQLLVLEPLFKEFSAEEVAAAASALLRAKRPAKPEPGAGRPGLKTWSRLFMSVGERDGIRAGDIVGAITGESGVKGEEVGRVDIRDTFCVVEVESTAADKIIRALNGTTMKNRSLRVDYDRKTSGGSGRGAGGGGGRSGGGRADSGGGKRPPQSARRTTRG